MLTWVMNLGFAAGAGSAPSAPAREVGAQGTYLLLGAGCWVAPLLAVMLLLGSR